MNLRGAQNLQGGWEFPNPFGPTPKSSRQPEAALLRTPESSRETILIAQNEENLFRTSTGRCRLACTIGLNLRARAGRVRGLHMPIRMGTGFTASDLTALMPIGRISRGRSTR